MHTTFVNTVRLRRLAHLVRQAIPSVSGGHIAEALSAGMGYKTYAALKTGIDAAHPSPVVAVFSPAAAVQRLGALGAAKSLAPAEIEAAFLAALAQVAAEHAPPAVDPSAPAQRTQQKNTVLAADARGGRIQPSSMLWIAAMRPPLKAALLARMDADPALKRIAACLDVSADALPRAMAEGIGASPDTALSWCLDVYSANVPKALRKDTERTLSGSRPDVSCPAVACLVTHLHIRDGSFGNPGGLKGGAYAAAVAQVLSMGAGAWRGTRPGARAEFLGCVALGLGGQIDLLRSPRDRRRFVDAVTSAEEDDLIRLAGTWLAAMNSEDGLMFPHHISNWQDVMAAVASRGVPLAGMELASVEHVRTHEDVELVLGLNRCGLQLPSLLAACCSLRKPLVPFPARMDIDAVKATVLAALRDRTQPLLDVAKFCVEELGADSIVRKALVNRMRPRDWEDGSDAARAVWIGLSLPHGQDLERGFDAFWEDVTDEQAANQDVAAVLEEFKRMDTEEQYREALAVEMADVSELYARFQEGSVELGEGCGDGFCRLLEGDAGFVATMCMDIDLAVPLHLDPREARRRAERGQRARAALVEALFSESSSSPGLGQVVARAMIADGLPHVLAAMDTTTVPSYVEGANARVFDGGEDDFLRHLEDALRSAGQPAGDIDCLCERLTRKGVVRGPLPEEEGSDPGPRR